MSSTARRTPKTPHEIRSLAVESRRDPRTVQKAYGRVSGTVRDVARIAIAEAAERLGFEPPPLSAEANA